MVKVVVWGSLKPHTGGKAELEIEAGNVRELLDRLGETYPGLKPQLPRGVSVAIDGVIFRDGWHEPLPQTAKSFSCRGWSGARRGVPATGPGAVRGTSSLRRNTSAERQSARPPFSPSPDRHRKLPRFRCPAA